MKNKIIFFLYVFSLLGNLYAAPYSGTEYNGSLLEPKMYDGVEVYPFYYDGKLLYPISYCGSVIEGIFYEGIDLTNYKVTVHTITGNETSSDFYDKSVPQEYRVNWKKIIGKYAIGTTVLVVTGILTVCSGSITAATVGYIAAGAFEGAIIGASTGVLIEGIISGTIAYFNGEPQQKVFKEAVEASADGFMWGAITGAVAGGWKSAKELSKGSPLLNSKGKITYIKDDKGIVYRAKGGEPQGHILDKKNKNGNYEFFVGEKGRLVDLDGNVVAEHFTIKHNGMIKEIPSGKPIGYVDSKGVLATGDDMKAAIKKDIRELPGNINAKLKGDVNPNTGVPYKQKIVTDEDGVRFRGVFPEFTPEYECRLPKELYLVTDKSQFRNCIEQLKAYLEANPKEKARFTAEQLEQIWNLDTPDGFVWHHVESPPGKMQLVDFNTHANTRHNGGKSIWGGGKAYR